MMEQLLQLDTQLLLVINGCHNLFFDNWMWNISEKLTWFPLYITLVVCLVHRFGKKSIFLLLAFGACVGLADFISSGIIKDWVMRPRPTREPALEGVLHLVNDYRSGKYGFVSSHAANSVSLCLLFSLIWRDLRATLPLALYALLNCYSRMYLGVHYPGDILGGVIVGTIVALGVYGILRKTKLLIKELPAEKQAYHWSIMGITILSLLIMMF